jgi:hypothetical protein
MTLRRLALLLGIALPALVAATTGIGLAQTAKATDPPTDTPPPPTSADFGAKTGQAAATPDLANLAIDDLRTRANAEDPAAMEELARRLLQGIGVAKDQQAGAGWLLRAAERGSMQAAFNAGVMYERGFVVERDATRAVEWYRKAAQAGMPMAKHNLALLLRDGKGTPPNAKEAIALLRSATREGMAASMFALGDLYERSETRDPASALAWFAITAEFERQTNRGGESTLAKAAIQRADALRRSLPPADLDRAQQIGDSEFRQIVEALQPSKPADTLPAPALPEAKVDPSGWPGTSADQVRAIQQALVDLDLLRNKPDGVLGPMTRTAIRTFQKNAGLRETGEATKDVFNALQDALARRTTTKAN